MLFRSADDGGLNQTTQYEYDENGNQTSQINPNGVVTNYEYDPLNRLVRTILDSGGLGIEQQYEYDAVGNKTSETNPNSHTTTYQYDTLNRLRIITDPLGNVTEHRYFTSGGGCGCGTPGSSLLSCLIDAEGKVTKYEYDALNRQIKMIYQVGIKRQDAEKV